MANDGPVDGVCMLGKAEVRAKFRALRDSFAKEFEPNELRRSLAQNLSQTLSNGGLWVSYKARNPEADPSGVTEVMSCQWAYPKVDGDHLRFFIPQAVDALKKSEWGIMEPDPKKSTEVNLEAASGVLVPGVAFDRRGGRVGYGKGFYDRALKNYQGIKIGVAYSVQIAADPLPTEPLDVHMDFVVTEQEVINVRKGKFHG